MCGIFGAITQNNLDVSKLKSLVRYARQRGRDSSGLAQFSLNKYLVTRVNKDINKLFSTHKVIDSKFVMGHSRLITNGLSDNQPVVRDGLILIHNGIIVNDKEIWNDISVERKFEIDSEAITGLAIEFFNQGGDIKLLGEYIYQNVKGTVSCALAIPKLGKLILISDNGSLYLGDYEKTKYFSSEKYPLQKIGCQSINQVKDQSIILNIPISVEIKINDVKSKIENSIPVFKNSSDEENMLIYEKHNLKRCTKCILPSTMTFIEFDDNGICNYCNNYQLKNIPKPKKELFDLVKEYRQNGKADCIVPFSGGRDSCYSLI